MSNTAIEVVEFDAPISYADAYRLQLERRDAVERGEASNALFLLEHTPVITMGRNAKRAHVIGSSEELAAIGVDLVESTRGGDVTYHGPGQLVAYPILNLRHWNSSIRWYLRELETVLIDLLARFDLEGKRIQGLTGVWVGGAKVAAIGIGVHNWIAYHGIALNVNPDMDHFRLIVPCGIADRPVTSLRALLNRDISVPDVSDAFRDTFLARF